MGEDKPELPDFDLESLWPTKDEDPDMKIIDIPEGLSIEEALKLDQGDSDEGDK